MKHSTLARASQIAYDNGDQPADVRFANLGFPRVRFFEDKETDTQVYIASNSRENIIVHRGTEVDKLKDFLIDADVRYSPFLYGNAHAGFLRGMASVFYGIDRELANPQIREQKNYLTGHSLGAGESFLLAGALHYKIEEFVGFGCPRPADSALVEGIESRVPCTVYRNNNDIVTRIPSDLRFEQIHNIPYFDSKGRLHRNIPLLKRLVENMKGRFAKDGGLFDGLTDHDMSLYVDLLERNDL